MKLQAQDDPPCKPDCDSSEWQPLFPAGASEIVVTICNKPIRIRYRWRYACNSYYDYYIELVGSDMGEIRNCINTTYGTLDGFMQEVTKRLIIANPANFPPAGSGCVPNWRVMKGSCWAVAFVMGIPGTPAPPPYERYGYVEFAYPCTTDDCCLEYFLVCIQNGQRVVTQTGFLPPEDPDCSGWGPPSLPHSCQPVCGSIYNR